MIILRLLLLLTNLHLKLLSTQGTGADKLLSTQRVKTYFFCRFADLSSKKKYDNTHFKKNDFFSNKKYFRFFVSSILI